VVDFLYHPDAEFWADHHSTSFLSAELREQFESRRNSQLLYDSSSSSCALLLWGNLATYLESDSTRYKEMVYWADKIDSAAYADVSEAILGTAPALQIHRSLLRRADEEYCTFLIQVLREKHMADVVELGQVKSREAEAVSLIRTGLDYFRRFAYVENGDIVICEIDVDTDKIISRYAPFYFFPQARYSIVLLRGKSGAKITAMRNPWNEFPSVPMGRIFELHGGGGHDRVGSVVFKGERASQAASTMREIVDEIERCDDVSPVNLRRALA